LVWVELVPLAFWLAVLLAVVDVLLARCCNWISGMSLMVRCSEPSTMVERMWVGGLFGAELCGKSSSGWRRWLNHLGGIVRDVLELGTWWAPNIGIQKPKAIQPRTQRCKVRVAAKVLESTLIVKTSNNNSVGVPSMGT
jgi:hypothetical protein